MNSRHSGHLLRWWFDHWLRPANLIAVQFHAHLDKNKMIDLTNHHHLARKESRFSFSVSLQMNSLYFRFYCSINQRWVRVPADSKNCFVQINWVAKNHPAHNFWWYCSVTRATDSHPCVRKSTLCFCRCWDSNPRPSYWESVALLN